MSAVPFVRRHVGPSPEDIDQMASAVGAQSLDDLIDQTVPESIRLRTPLNLPAARSEEAALAICAK
jgi:glycine dehydrogenase